MALSPLCRVCLGTALRRCVTGGEVGTVACRLAAGGSGSDAACARARCAVASGGLLKRRGAGAQVHAGRAGRQHVAASSAAYPAVADSDRRDGICWFLPDWRVCLRSFRRSCQKRHHENVTPEYNPFKYNSFPVNAARQSYLLTKALQQQISRDARSSRLNELPPVLTFQSIMDSTVAPVRWWIRFIVILAITAVSWCCSISIRPPVCVRCCAPIVYRHYSVVTACAAQLSHDNYHECDAGNAECRGARYPGREHVEQVQPLPLAWPQEMYSLSHVAVPFPLVIRCMVCNRTN